MKIIPGSGSVKSISGSDALLYRDQKELFDEKVSAKNLMVLALKSSNLQVVW